MKLLKVTLPAVVASLLLVVVFAWAQSAQAKVLQPGDFMLPDSLYASNSNLPTSSDVISSVLPAGDSYIHGLIYYQGYLYASTRSCTVTPCPYPARVLKINPITLSVVATATLTSRYAAEDITAANGYIWVILYMKPARLIRLDPGHLTWKDALVFNKSVADTMEAGESLKYAFGYLWAGGTDHLAQVNITQPLTPTYQLYDLSFLNLPGTSDGVLGSLAHDDQFLWGTYKQYSNSTSSFYSSTVVRMDPNNPTVGYKRTEISTDTPDDSAYTAGAYFVGGEGKPNGTAASYIYKFSADPAVYTATKAADSASYGIFADPVDPLSVWGAYVAKPGLVKIFDQNAIPLKTVTLPDGFNNPSEIVFDDSGDVYITTWQDPARIVKLTPPYLPADLSIALNGAPDPVFAGNDITYTLVITNNGPLNAPDVLVTDTLPSQVSFISSVPGSSQCSIHNQILTCSLGEMSAHSSRQVVISAHVGKTASGTITNSAQATSSMYDNDPQNNTASINTHVYHHMYLPVLR